MKCPFLPDASQHPRSICTDSTRNKSFLISNHFMLLKNRRWYRNARPGHERWAVREPSLPTWKWQWQKLAARPHTLHTNLLCAYKCLRNKLKLMHLISCTAVTLVKWKIMQNLIMDVSCITDTSPADPLSIALPPPFPHKKPYTWKRTQMSYIHLLY